MEYTTVGHRFESCREYQDQTLIHNTHGTQNTQSREMWHLLLRGGQERTRLHHSKDHRQAVR